MPTVHALGEVRLIERIRQRLGRQGIVAARRQPPGAAVRVGIGDDAAVLQGPRASQLLLASDMLVEGVHFRRQLVSAQWIGWKALACNISDVAAMGGWPLCAVVSLGVPPTTSVRFVEALYDGLRRCARRFGLAIVGGDTVRSAQVVVDVAILGAVSAASLTLRSGAKVGDVLFVTGRLGGSYRSGRHARFLPRLREAQALLRRVRVHAMMDLSDGLAADLWQMSRASRVTLRVAWDRIPVSRDAESIRHAMTDGEDFELLFAVGARDAGRVPSRVGACPITRIGAVVGRGVGVEVEYPDGSLRPVPPAAFQHF